MQQIPDPHEYLKFPQAKGCCLLLEYVYSVSGRAMPKTFGSHSIRIRMLEDNLEHIIKTTIRFHNL